MKNNLDLAIIGSGPAALTAALYAARLGLSVEVFEKAKFGGALPQISHLANFPGFDGAGSDFTEKLVAQAKSAGAKLSYGTCTSVNPLIIDDETVSARAILIATGTEPRTLDFEITPSISYCVLCDAPLYKDKNIAVVGGGNSALGESLHLAKIAKTVTIICHNSVKADTTFRKQIATHSNITILENTEPTKAMLDKFDGVFVFIGKRPATTFVPDSMRDDGGFVITDDKHRVPDTNIFAAGDVRASTLKQAIMASADGAAAAVDIVNFLKQ